MLSILIPLLALTAVSAVPHIASSDPALLVARNDAPRWAQQWQPDCKASQIFLLPSQELGEVDGIANGVVNYGYNSSFGQGFNNATQLRLAYRGCTGMSVSFSTNQRQDTPQVRYGTSNTTLDCNAYSSVSITYETSPKWENHVVLDGLSPDTKYYYQVCDGPIYSFTTARCAGDMTPYSTAVVVDMGTMGEYGLSSCLPKGIDYALQPNETNTLQRLVAQKADYDFVIHPGDMAYADYWAKQQITHGSNLTIQDQILGYNAINEAFFDEVSEVAKWKPYMAGVGNHEANCINGGYKQYTEAICTAGLTNFTEYKVRWNMPGDGSPSNNLWYSFDHGMVHYLVFDTETDLPAPYIAPDVQGGSAGMHEANVGSYPNAQVDFIKNDLAAVDRSKTPWVIALGHRPWYAPSIPDYQFMDGLAVFEPLFTAGNVDMVMHGHVHLMGRTFPVWKNGTIQQDNYIEPQAPVYIVNGAAGHYDGLDAAANPLPSFIAFANDTTYAWSKLTFHNATHLTHAFLASSDNSVIDEITIQRTH